MRKQIFTEGQKVGNCLYLKDIGERKFPSGNSERIALFRCECGNEFSALLMNVKSRHTVSCGCIYKKTRGKSSLTHGCATKEMRYKTGYSTYLKMISRCTNETDKAYHIYGAVGRGVSDDWRYSFDNFRRDMGDKPTSKHTLERVDNNKGYSKENCIWATMEVQSNNKSNNINIEYRGQTKNVTQWANLLGIDVVLAREQYRRREKPMEYVVAFGIVNKLKKKRLSFSF